MSGYRPARPAPTAWNVVKTLALLMLFWFLYLYVFPIAISIAEIELGIQRFPPQPRLALGLLIAFTALSVWAALTLAVGGRGTPAPFDTARELVTGGPYAFVRNPLIIAAAGQGVAIGIMFGSVPVLAYVSLCVAVWYFIFRKREERDLERRFGPKWREYRNAVRGFRPRLTPYRAHRVGSEVR